MQFLAVILASIFTQGAMDKNRPETTDRPGQFEERTARILVDFKRLLFKENVKSLKELEKLVSTQYKFNVFKTPVELANSILEARNKPVTLTEKCLGLPTTDGNSFENDFKEKILQYCHQKFLKTRLKDFSSQDKTQVFKDYLSRYFVELNRNSSFREFLKKKGEDKDFQKLVTEIISENFDGTSLKTPEIFLKHLETNPSFAEKIQQNGVLQDESKLVIKREFKHLADQVETSIEEGSKKIRIDELTQFYIKNKKYIDQDWAWKSFAQITDDAIYFNLADVAKKATQFLLDEFQDVETDENYFRGLWQYVYHQKWEQAVGFIEEQKLIEKFSKTSSRVKFWTAYTLLKSDELSMAVHLFKLVYQTSPLSYYSILAMKTLSEVSPRMVPMQFIRKYRRPGSSPIKGDTVPAYSYTIKLAYKRLELWTKLKAQLFIDNESEFILDHDAKEAFDVEEATVGPNDNEAKQILVADLVDYLSKSKSHLSAFKIAFDSLDQNLFDVNQEALKLLFPLEYREVIKKYDSSIDPLLVLSLIRQESAFNPDARSWAGASGLMQLMPKTAKLIGQKGAKIQLSNPETNIKIGLQYFKKLLKKYDGNLIYTLASYNAGEGRVKKWKGHYFKKEDPLLQVESIPFKETRLYVKLIYRNYFFYNILMDKNNIRTPISESFTAKI